MKIRPLQFELKDFALALYGLSLMLPATNEHHEVFDVSPYSYGWHILLSGILAVMDGGIAWLANIAFIPAYLYRNARKSLICSIIAIAMGLTSFSYTSIWNDGAGRISITSYSYGFYVWMLSFAWLAATSVIELQRDKRRSLTASS
ncbi:hypothetical protein FIV41_15805 [Pseudomonas marginalis]|uniref:Uncharacterized protein n=1 Tax=Pseudomonas marginalis TaxID=298 RepID=A0A9X9BT13_PSEMA|nr:MULTISPECIES: hypothetical protein [Pseudomonas]MDT9634449.1 hypothetical protein [Pseudomonas sp. JV449]TKJ78671.1 hypothetical protein PspCFBP13509_15480 [Pseudomonas sp. CFBP13509]TWR59009.1 hypothetical protein FIV41_15805 [Pseudomonas marginalis]SEC50864.1 hypothetical protein SAMN04490193_2915 [Pseudomonas marginalis]